VTSGISKSVPVCSSHKTQRNFYRCRRRRLEGRMANVCSERPGQQRAPKRVKSFAQAHSAPTNLAYPSVPSVKRNVSFYRKGRSERHLTPDEEARLAVEALAAWINQRCLDALPSGHPTENGEAQEPDPNSFVHGHASVRNEDGDVTTVHDEGRRTNTTATTTSDDPSWLRAIRRGSKRGETERNEKDVRIAEVNFGWLRTKAGSSRFRIDGRLSFRRPRSASTVSQHSLPIAPENHLGGARQEVPLMERVSQHLDPTETAFCAALSELVTEKWATAQRGSSLSDFQLEEDSHGSVRRRSVFDALSTGEIVGRDVPGTSPARFSAALATPNSRRVSGLVRPRSKWDRVTRARILKYTGLVVSSSRSVQTKSARGSSSNIERSTDAWMCGVCGKAFTTVRGKYRLMLVQLTTLRFLSLTSFHTSCYSARKSPHCVRCL
jgi:hypothetical protein